MAVLCMKSYKTYGLCISRCRKLLSLKEFNSVPTLGSVEVGVNMDLGTCKAIVMASEHREKPNFIIGDDFLSTHDCDLFRLKLFF